jgi:hypothetical protein
MVFQQTNFTRLFPTAPSGGGLMTSTNFGFASGGKRFFDVTIHGQPRIEQGMTVVALLEKTDGWEGDGLWGWVDCSDGSIACGSALRLFSVFLLSLFFAIMFPLRVYVVIENHTYAHLIALFIVVAFGGTALRFLYLSVKTLLVKRALVAVRNVCQLENVNSSNIAVERGASPQSGSRPSP